MKLHLKIPFSELDSIPKLVKDFLEGNLETYREDSFSVENFSQKISQKSTEFKKEKRRTLYEAIKNQFSEVAMSQVQQKNLDSLLNENTFTVTTGHQLNLFTGPVFFIYKILQTIKTASFLNEKFLTQHFVPVFWMATEDHDFQEINHFKTETNFYEISGKSGGAVGRIEIEDRSFISGFQEEFQDSVFGTELIRMLNEAYTKGENLANATRILVNRIFSEYGLLIIDGDDSSLKKAMQTVFTKELFENALIHHTAEDVENLKKNYGKVQVNPREINLFYLSDTRNRIIRDGEKFKVDETDIIFSEEEILEILKTNPEKFSPNALLRPLYQEKILPNVAYIGGNAEIMYWLELKNYFKKMGITFPILIPRNSMLFLKEKTLNKAQKQEVLTEDFFRDFAGLIKDKLTSIHPITQILEEKERLIKENFNQLKSAAEVTDITFGNLVAAEEKRQLRSYERMKRRLLRAEKIKNSEKLERLERLFLEVHPGKIWQERVYNFSVFYADYGRQWLETCLKEMDVQKSELIIMVV